MSDRLLIALVALAFIIAAIPIALGFVLGAMVWGAVVGYRFARRAIVPPVSLPSQFEDEDD